MPLLSVTPLYIAILGLLFIPFTLYVGVYRAKSKISIGHGDDPELLRRMRAQANFIETVPIALILLATMELIGAGNHTVLHGLGIALVVGRISHYLQLSGLAKPIAMRATGMLLTLAVYAVASIFLLINLT